jgi:hypothetical protein
VSLPNEANLSVAKFGELSISELCDIFAAKPYLTFRWTVQSAKQVQQSAFSGSGLPDKGESLSLLNLKMKILKDYEVVGPGAVPFRQSDGFDS